MSSRQFNPEAISRLFTVGVEHDSLLSINMIDSNFPQFFGAVIQLGIQCEIKRRSMSVVKSSPQVF